MGFRRFDMSRLHDLGGAVLFGRERGISMGREHGVGTRQHSDIGSPLFLSMYLTRLFVCWWW